MSELRNLPGPSAPYDVAQVILDGHFTLPNGVKTLVRHRGYFYMHAGTHYVRLALEALEKQVYQLTGDAIYAGPRGELRNWDPNVVKVRNVIHALGALVLIDDAVDPGTWLDGREKGTIIACQNGLLRLEGRKLLAHTPLYFNQMALPFDYDPHAKSLVWDKFMKDLWGEDDEPVLALEEVRLHRRKQARSTSYPRAGRAPAVRQEHHPGNHRGAGRLDERGVAPAGRPDRRQDLVSVDRQVGLPDR